MTETTAAPAAPAKPSPFTSVDQHVEALNGKPLTIWWEPTPGEFRVSYGGQAIMKGATVIAALGAAKANHDALAARKVAPGVVIHKEKS